MPLLKRKRVFAAKVETTPGTAETLTNAEASYNAYDLVIQPSVEVEQREGQGAFNYLQGVPGARMGTATFRTDLGWDGTSTMPTWASVLLPACGWVETSQVYNPTTESPGTNVKTLTIASYQAGNGSAGKRRLLTGAVGTFTINLPAGRMGFIEWEFTGVWGGETAAAVLAPTYPTASPIRFASATATFDSVDLTVENISFAAGNQVVMREDGSTASGYISGIITNREPRITCNPESVLIATQDRIQAWLNADEEAFSVALDGPSPSSTTSTITIAAPKAQIINNQEGDRNRLVTDELELSCNKNGTTNDQELRITFAESTS